MKKISGWKRGEVGKVTTCKNGHGCVVESDGKRYIFNCFITPQKIQVGDNVKFFVWEKHEYSDLTIEEK